MALHVLARRLAPFVAVPVGLVVPVIVPGTSLTRLLAGFLAFGVVLWVGDVVWKAGASPEERRRDLEERTRDFP